MSSLQSFIVLVRLPQTQTLSLYPAAAVDASQALALVGNQLTQQGNADALLIGALGEEDLIQMVDMVARIKQQIADHG